MKVRFIRRRGRIIPIKTKLAIGAGALAYGSYKMPKQSKKIGQGFTTGGAVASLGASTLASINYKTSSLRQIQKLNRITRAGNIALGVGAAMMFLGGLGKKKRKK